MNKSRNLSLYKDLIVSFIIICFLGIVYSVVNLIMRNLHINENSLIKEKIGESVEVVVEHQESSEPKLRINFEALKNVNSDVVGFIKVNNTNIDYAVVQGDDNDYYLHHNFEKNWNVAGWVFADFRNKMDGSDKNIILYGHNISDGSMFGSLQNVLNSDWYENQENYEVIFATENGEYYYQVFSVYSTTPEEYYINTDFENDDVFDDFVHELKKRSVYDFGVNVSKDDKILTLSSCLGAGEKRVVLHGKLLGSR